MKRVYFCRNNFRYGTDKVAESFKSREGEIKAVVEGCLGQCSDCASMPIAVIDNHLVSAPSPEELIKKINGVDGRE